MAKLRTLVVLRNGSAFGQVVDTVGIEGEFVSLSRNGKTVALFRSDSVAAVIDSVTKDSQADFAFKTIVGNEAMQSWVDSVQEELLNNKSAIPLVGK